jgi:hypothetical protein
LALVVGAVCGGRFGAHGGLTPLFRRKKPQIPEDSNAPTPSMPTLTKENNLSNSCEIFKKPQR